jgi:hypothetical protein
MMDGFLEQKNCFAICTPKRNFYISAPDNKTMGDWVEAIGTPPTPQVESSASAGRAVC